MIVLVYGPQSDWAQNVMAAGEATLEIDGDEVGLTNPRVVPLDEAFAKLLEDAKRPPGLLRISECLVMDAEGGDDRPS